MEISQKHSNFALVIEFERHIEILLLSNDCVILPNFGAFITYDVDARYDADEGLFLPPLRTLGFNPQLKDNDSLLVQNYVECYDISYPEALRRILDEVNELRQHLEIEGYYEMNNIGEFRLTSDGRLEFEPCEAGILTPSLYGLGSFEMPMLSKPEKKHKKQKHQEESKPNAILTTTAMPPSDHDEAVGQEPGEEQEHAITIKMSWIRNMAAVAAAIIAFFLMASPIDNSELQENTMVSKTHITMIPTDTSVKVARIDSQAVKHAIEQRGSSVKVNANDEVVATPPVPQASHDNTVEEQQKHNSWMIVLASQVTRKNATAFADRLKKAGISDARVFERNKIVRVICGDYATQNDAYAELVKIRKTGLVDDPWVMKARN